jgi:hypothetical protein
MLPDVIFNDMDQLTNTKNILHILNGSIIRFKANILEEALN